MTFRMSVFGRPVRQVQCRLRVERVSSRPRIAVVRAPADPKPGGTAPERQQSDLDRPLTRPFERGAPARVGSEIEEHWPTLEVASPGTAKQRKLTRAKSAPRSACTRIAVGRLAAVLEPQRSPACRHLGRPRSTSP